MILSGAGAPTFVNTFIHEDGRVHQGFHRGNLRGKMHFCNFRRTSSISRQSQHLPETEIYIRNRIYLLFLFMFLYSRLLLWIMRKPASKSRKRQNFGVRMQFFALFRLILDKQSIYKNSRYTIQNV
jgi:hypothetical protein